MLARIAIVSLCLEALDTSKEATRIWAIEQAMKKRAERSITPKNEKAKVEANKKSEGTVSPEEGMTNKNKQAKRRRRKAKKKATEGSVDVGGQSHIANDGSM